MNNGFLDVFGGLKRNCQEVLVEKSGGVRLRNSFGKVMMCVLECARLFEGLLGRLEPSPWIMPGLRHRLVAFLGSKFERL